MRNKIGYTAKLLTLVFLFTSCEKSGEQLILDQEYLHVADVLEFCQGSCLQDLEWENTNLWVKGYVLDVANDSIVDDYINNQRFYLLDIRNGMFLEVTVEDDKNAIFSLLLSLEKNDELFLKTTAFSIILNEGNDCEKGVFLSVYSSDDIAVNL